MTGMSGPLILNPSGMAVHLRSPSILETRLFHGEPAHGRPFLFLLFTDVGAQGEKEQDLDDDDNPQNEKILSQVKRKVGFSLDTKAGKGFFFFFLIYGPV